MVFFLGWLPNFGFQAHFCVSSGSSCPCCPRSSLRMAGLAGTRWALPSQTSRAKPKVKPKTQRPSQQGTKKASQKPSAAAGSKISGARWGLRTPQKGRSARDKKVAQLKGAKKSGSRHAGSVAAVETLVGLAAETDAAHLSRHRGKSAAGQCARCKPLAHMPVRPRIRVLRFAFLIYHPDF